MKLNPENEHLLCWCHVRAKFKLAFDISKDKDAGWFVEQIGRLYAVELENRLLNRNYRYDGRYDIDNLEAERMTRPLTIGRKNTLFFGSEEGVELATTYSP